MTSELFFLSKSSGSKTIREAPGSTPSVATPTCSAPSEIQAESDVTVSIMTAEHFIDTKVIKTCSLMHKSVRPNQAGFTCMAATGWSSTQSLTQTLCLQGGTNLIINSLGPVHHSLEKTTWFSFTKEKNTKVQVRLVDA